MNFMNSTILGRETEIPPTTTTRPSSTAVFRGSDPPPDLPGGSPPDEQDGSITMRQRVLGIKADLWWGNEPEKEILQRLRDLSWQAAYYRNSRIRRLWAEAMGWQTIEAAGDKHSITKQGRKQDKGQLSGAAYSAAEREVDGVWKRMAREILAGRPLPEWRPNAALSIRGHKNKKESGVRLEWEDGQYVCYLSAQSTTSEGGCWLRIPIAKHTRRDDFQGTVLDAMVSWEVPIAKATVEIGTRKTIIRMTYALPVVLPKFGERVAVFGPLERDGRLHLRSETSTVDYTSKIQNIIRRKDEWDKIRRRVVAQIGRRKGHARAKRERLARLSWDTWIDSYLHEWSMEIVKWCKTQGVKSLRVNKIDNADWPAFKFMQNLAYKTEAAGIAMEEGTDLKSQSAERALHGALAKIERKNVKRQKAVRELLHQMGD